MILEPNVPKSVRHWAVCRVRIRKLEQVIDRLSVGNPMSLGQYWLMKKLGREKFIEQKAKPQLRRSTRWLRRYRAIAGAIESQSEPQKHLIGKREMLELIGNTLHFTRHHKETFLTLQYCSTDGERLFFNGDSGGIDALDLLGFGFGRA